MNALKAKVEENYGTGKFEIIGFPSSNFNKQEPGANSEILKGLQYVRPGNGYVPNFIMTQKGDVNGDKEQALFTFLKKTCDRPTPFKGSIGSMFWSPIKHSDILWNYEKFLVDATGKPFKRYTIDFNPTYIYKDVAALIDKANGTTTDL